MNLIIDIGNTRIKIAIFDKNLLVKKVTSPVKDLHNNIKVLQKNYPLTNAIISSVSEFKEIIPLSNSSFNKLIKLDRDTKVPFKNNYKTPKTLGVDRIALASGAVSQFPNQNTLVIDAGTCVTYDFINAKNLYYGGAISPGIGIRYKSLHKFTANLPQLEQDSFELTGADTEGSIHSGVLNGIIQEIDGIIDQYLTKYQTLTVILTGGDTNFLAKKLKSTIFANPNFLLEGLNSILIHNLDE